MTITVNDDEVRELIKQHVAYKFKVSIGEVYLLVDEESGTFSHAEAEIDE